MNLEEDSPGNILINDQGPPQAAKKRPQADTVKDPKKDKFRITGYSGMFSNKRESLVHSESLESQQPIEIQSQGRADPNYTAASTYDQPQNQNQPLDVRDHYRSQGDMHSIG
jgi:hypothetical protein